MNSVVYLLFVIAIVGVLAGVALLILGGARAARAADR
jgi:type II secretory pathway pseudopilin PulG